MSHNNNFSGSLVNRHSCKWTATMYRFDRLHKTQFENPYKLLIHSRKQALDLDFSFVFKFPYMDTQKEIPLATEFYFNQSTSNLCSSQYVQYMNYTPIFQCLFCHCFTSIYILKLATGITTQQYCQGCLREPVW